MPGASRSMTVQLPFGELAWLVLADAIPGRYFYNFYTWEVRAFGCKGNEVLTGPNRAN